MTTIFKGWDLASSCYFTFVTLTTIGFDNNPPLFITIGLIVTIIVAIIVPLVRFGDMVPGQNDMGSGGMGFEQIAKMMVTLWLQRLLGSFSML